MKQKKYLAVLAALFFFAGQAYADCPISMTYDQLVDCIVVEGAGDTYQPPKTN